MNTRVMENPAPSSSHGVGLLGKFLVFPALLFLLWVAGAAWLPYAIASPGDTWAAFLHGVNRGWMKKELITTLTATFLSFALATVGGVGFAIAVALNRFWAEVWEPILIWLYSVPKIVLYPIILMLFGISSSTSVAFGVVNSVLPVAFILFGVIGRIPPIYMKVARSYGLGRWRSFWQIVMPVAAPSIVTAARLAFCLSFLAVVVAEMLGSRQGLGQELFKAVALNDAGRIFAIAVVLSIIAVAVNALFLVAEHLLFRNRRA